MRTPVEVLLAVAHNRGRLLPNGDRLRISLPADCPAGLRDAIRQHKAELLKLLRLDFLVVRSDVLRSTVIWTQDEASKKTLVSMGAHPGMIYTKAELAHLLQRKVSPHDLLMVHAGKQRFSGRVTGPQRG